MSLTGPGPQVTQITTGSLVALNSELTIDCTELASIGFQISGTWTGTIIFLYSMDNINFNIIYGSSINDGGSVPLGSPLVWTTNGNGTWRIDTATVRSIQLSMDSYTSGTANIVVNGTTYTVDQNPVRIRTSADEGITLGQKTMALSLPFVIAGDQSAIPVNVQNSVTVTQGTSPWVVSGSTTVSGTVTVSNFPTTVDANYGTVGASTLRTAAQIGNATGAASFNYGAASAQTLRTASQIGNATGAADFNAGATGAQTLRVTANQGTSPWVVSGTVTSSNFPTTLDTNYGVVGASTLRGAAQIGNATGAALFGAGTTTAQVLRVVLPTDQTAIPATQSGTWTVQPGNTANSTPWLTTDTADGPVTPGTVATKSQLMGGQFNTVLPTLTNTQQSAVQLDSSGRLIISPVTQTISGTVTVSNFPTTLDTNYGTVGASTLRTASQIGNATGAALFGAGTTTAQVLRVVLPTDQTVIPVQGQKTNNNAAPGATNEGVLPALANAAAASWSEGNQVALSTDLAGNARVIDIADGPVAPGTAATKSTLVGGQFNTTLPTLTNTQQAAFQVDVSGRHIVTNVPLAGIAQTYSASGLVTSAASATDIFSIIGSATKTVMITNLVISGIATSANVVTVIILKRSTADTVGTPTTLTNVPNDSADAAGTAVCTTYAGVPTTGTLVGNMKTFKIFLPPPTGGNANSPSFPVSFPGTFSQPITLRGAAQTLAINLAGVTITGAIFAVSVEWIEF